MKAAKKEREEEGKETESEKKKKSKGKGERREICKKRRGAEEEDEAFQASP